LIPKNLQPRTLQQSNKKVLDSNPKTTKMHHRVQRGANDKVELYKETQHKTVSSQMNSNISTVGRPASKVNIPKGKFTFLELCAANKHLAQLTLRNFMRRDAELQDHSQIVRIDDERGSTGSDAGYGRKPYLYVSREYVKNGKKTHKTTKYHVHKAKAPTHTLTRRELNKTSDSHSHKVVSLVPKDSTKTATSVIISFAPIADGAPVPTSVTVNFSPNAKPEVKIESNQPEAQHEIMPVAAPVETKVEAPVATPEATAPVAEVQAPTPTVEPQQVEIPHQPEQPKAKRTNGSKSKKNQTPQPTATITEAPSTDAPPIDAPVEAAA
jgi:hypothetical protein